MKTLLTAALVLASACSTADPTTADKTAAATVDASQQLMRPVQDAANKTLQEIKANDARRRAELKAKQDADREAKAKKIYRWKDKDGTPHISDQAPPAGTPNVTVTLRP